jgi:hypothetical protein
LRFLIWAAAAPILAAAALLAAFVGLELAGRTPLAYRPPANVAEAAGMGMAAEVLRFIRLGERPGLVWDVHPEVISSSVTRVTALEAAVWSRRLRVIRLLEREGAIDGPVREHLACVSRHIGADDIEAYLAPRGIPGCDPERTVRDIEARAR